MTETAKRTEVLAKWVEVYNSGIVDRPPHSKRFEFSLFINNCTARANKSGQFVERSKTVEFIEANSQEELDQKVIEYVSRDGVRLLANDIKCNEESDVPRRERLTDALLNGTDAIYQPTETP